MRGTRKGDEWNWGKDKKGRVAIDEVQNWPTWKKQFAADIYGVSVDKFCGSNMDKNLVKVHGSLYWGMQNINYFTQKYTQWTYTKKMSWIVFRIRHLMSAIDFLRKDNVYES
jgi:hypothetical protein